MKVNGARAVGLWVMEGGGVLLQWGLCQVVPDGLGVAHAGCGCESRSGLDGSKQEASSYGNL